MPAFGIAIGVLLTLAAFDVIAQTDLQRAQNLATCLAGRYPTLCKRQWLSAEELTKVEIAESRENLKTCLAGRYPTLCNRSRLTSAELDNVNAAERRENLKICLAGRYRTLCRKHLLTEEELVRVLAAENAENIKMCLDGRYPTLCNRSLLTPEHLAQAQAAEARKTQIARENAAKSRPTRSRRFGSSICESGHWVQSVSGNGQIVQLEDGSIWQVDAVDAIISMLWLPSDEIVVCDGKLINADDRESVEAIRIR